ncbi:MAG: metallopeptidase family protein [Candidatus Aminicenantes bacterium]|jgi:predicted Zn-dependent protease with MMP-like domain
MERERFEELVEEALADLPKEFKERLQNITVIVEEKPSREVYERLGGSPFNLILGLYHGVPFKHRGPFYGNVPPDVITIYQKPIEEICFTEEEIKKKVKEVVVHEIAHYFGFDDKELKKIENQ